MTAYRRALAAHMLNAEPDAQLWRRPRMPLRWRLAALLAWVGGCGLLGLATAYLLAHGLRWAVL